MIISGLLLIFLLPDWTESVEPDTVDINTLARIIDFVEQKLVCLQFLLKIKSPKLMFTLKVNNKVKR